MFNQFIMRHIKVYAFSILEPCVRMFCGRAFQSRGAEHGKALSPLSVFRPQNRHFLTSQAKIFLIRDKTEFLCLHLEKCVATVTEVFIGVTTASSSEHKPFRQKKKRKELISMMFKGHFKGALS